MTETRHYRAMQGTTYTLGRIPLAFKRTEGDAEGAFSVVESIEPPGSGAGLHRHPGFEEKFIVCEGRFEFVVGGARHEVAAGEMIFVPRGTPHSLKSLGPENGRLVTISSPAGIFEAFIAEVASAMVDTGTPGGAPAVDFRGIAARHGIEFL
jgi:mannose-6-phosphate isomerase-like protein (cupin superfamily)